MKQNNVKTINQSFEVIWKHLTYSVRQGLTKNKVILDSISGGLKSGQLMAIMGPSGCGKSSLLGCLSGTNKKGVIGSITISTKRKIKLSFIPQEDYLQNKLTGYELLLFSSKLQNMSGVDHKSNVERVVHLLNIDNCVDIKVKGCSGGQKKRISIALELVCRPDILILDEPTTGLDSATTWQMVNTLLELSELSPPMSIVATIHQPSARIFNLFHMIYIMSYDGQCLYHGSPQSMVTFFTQYGLKCPQYHNPPDFALEVASKEHGIGNVMLLTTINKIEATDLIPHQHIFNQKNGSQTLSDVLPLFWRTLKLNIRDIWRIPLQLAVHIVFSFMIILFYGSGSGSLSGCPNELVNDQGTFQENYLIVFEKLTENMSCITFTLMCVWFCAIISVLLTFPQEMNVFLKEYRNGWYSCFSYYLAIILVDIIIQLTIPNLMSVPIFVFTGQYWDQKWRLYYFIIIGILVALTSTSMGLVISAYLMKYPTAAVFIGSILAFPMLLFSGFLIAVKDMPEVFQWFTNINFIRFGLEAALTDIYGFDRCLGKTLKNTTQEFISEDKVDRIKASDKFNGTIMMNVLSLFSGQVSNDAQSIVMKKMYFEDNDLYYGIGMLCLIMISSKIITYFIILRKIKTIN